MTIKVDSIVNGVNTFLLGGGGVDGAIHKKDKKIKKVKFVCFDEKKNSLCNRLYSNK